MKFRKRSNIIQEVTLPSIDKLEGKISFIGANESQFPVEVTEVLTGHEIRLFYILKSMTVDGKVCHYPDQSELAKLLNTSQPTISRRITVLRIKRWVTLVHDNFKNIQGRNSLIVNEIPPSVESVLKSDHNYLVFLQECEEKGKGRIKHLSKEEFRNVPQAILQSHRLLIAETVDVNETSVSPLFTNELRKNQMTNPLFTDVLRYSPRYSPLFMANSPLFTTELRSDELYSRLFTGKFSLFTGELRDIYTTTRTGASTRRRISEGYKDNTTTSTGGEETRNGETQGNTRNYQDSGGSGGEFSFFERSPIIRELIADINAHEKYGKKATHAIVNLLKAKNYRTKNDVEFTWLASEEIACEMLCVILHDKPNSAIAYLKTLILADYNGEFYLKPSQQALLTSVHRRISPDYQPEQFAPKVKKLSPSQKLFEWCFENKDAVKEYKPLMLFEGDEIVVIHAFPIWQAEKGKTSVIMRDEWASEEDEDEIVLHTNFGSIMKRVSYEQICKAIELGVLKKC